MPVKIVYIDKDNMEGTLDDLLPIDDLSGMLTTITFPHHKAHEGGAFVSDYVDITLGDGNTIILAFKTPQSDKKAHLWIEFTTLVGGHIELWEGVTWTTNTGTVNPIINRNRGSANVSILLEDKTTTPAFTATGNILVNVTGLNTGSATSLHHLYAWGKKEKISAGGARDERELVLNPGTQYAAVFTAVGASNKAQVILNWYEN